jgi:hypothetical protein
VAVAPANRRVRRAAKVVRKEAGMSWLKLIRKVNPDEKINAGCRLYEEGFSDTGS